MHARSDAQESEEAAHHDKPALRIDQRCRVDGVLHSYLGEARLNEERGRIHVFVRDEWRPDTPDQLLVTLVRDRDLASSVVALRRRRFR